MVKRYLVLLFLATAFPCLSQTFPFRSLTASEQLQEFLELTNAQVSLLQSLNLFSGVDGFTRSQRRSQLQSEIAEETAKPTIDTTALGLRYRELELIRREEEGEKPKLRAALQALLTPAQRTKLGTLDQALRLRPAACAAVQLNLFMEPQPADLFFDNATTWLDVNRPLACPPAFRRGVFQPVQ